MTHFGNTGTGPSPTGRGSALRTSRRTLLKAGAAGLCIAALPGRLAAQPAMGGTLVMSIIPEPTSMTSAFNTASPLTIVSSKMAEGLLGYGYDLTPRPRLATAWEVAPDGLSIAFSLRQGVRWHDGEPFTSADVAYTILGLLKQYHPRGRNVFSRVTDVETPDDHTAILRLSEPAPALIFALSSSESPMLPRHVYEGTDILNNPANNAPVGTGPFRFVEWERGSHIILERNPDYWDEGKPHLDRLIVRTFTDASARSAAFEAGELMIAGDGPVPLSDVARFSGNPGFVVEERGTEMNNSLDVMEANLRNEHLAKVQVRQALMHAIDKPMMVDTVWYGLAEALNSPIPRTLPHFHTEDVPAYPFDPDRADALLLEAGYPRSGSAMRFTLRLTWPAIGETYDREAQFLRQSFRRVGVDLDLQVADVPSFIRRVYGEYDFDLSLLPASVTADPTIGLQRFYHSGAIAQGTPFVNASGYSNPEMDEVLERAAVEPDAEARRAHFARFQQIAMADLPILPIARPVHVIVANARVRDFMSGAEGMRDPFADLWLDG